MFDAERFYKDYHIPYWTGGKNVTPGWINVSCPYHADTNHLGYSPDGSYNCWKCGPHTVTSVIAHLLAISSGEAKKVVREYDVLVISRRRLNEVKSAKYVGKNIKTAGLPGTSLGKYHTRYLKKRGFNPDDIIAKYHVTGTGPAARWLERDFKLRIIIPIIEDGQIISFQARDITDKQELRYKGCPIELSVRHYKHTLYNIDNCPGSSIRLVEGITDVWRMGDGYAATFGTSMTDYQISLLARYQRILFLFDPEKEAQERARKGAEKLAAIGKEVELIELEKDCDPGDLSEEEAKQLRGLLK
jgi:DNA primase